DTATRKMFLDLSGSCRGSGCITFESRVTPDARIHGTHGYFAVRTIALAAARSAGGMTIIRALRNAQPLILSPSRLSAISHNTVASDPVMEGFEPSPRRGIFNL